MSDTISEKPASEVSSKFFNDAHLDEHEIKELTDGVLSKLNNDPGSFTTDDARILSEHVVEGDENANLSLGLAHRASLLTPVKNLNLRTAVEDLHAAVDAAPMAVTTEVLRTTQSIVSKMQKAVGHTNAPHPEVEAELQEEIARIEPKISRGTVTKAEADRLHSLEARAHGHTEKGGIAAAAQSAVAKRERQLSLSSGSGSSPNSGRSRANSRTFTSPKQQSRQDKEDNLHQAEAAIKPKIEQGTITEEDADNLHSLEMRAHGHVQKGGLSATAQSFVSRRCEESLSDASSTSPRLSEVDGDKDSLASENNESAIAA
ncbi:hypothetical protein EJ02DRAFT_452759 [Clathrospora elynae]|uniref:Uncharacterized protein n=1 Tax=Clathrospora elynae TaxID=706981 RepID=A0A6A5SWN0_9PLEO|nr:hypothetical protein EJ02DRAFT_452759 [Clathrospora elynae]